MKKKIRQIEIWSRRAVEELFAGEYHSVFKGAGLEFQEVREYQPGDDIRTIDWNVTARLGSPFVKRYIEERQRTIIFAVDVSSSGMFGSLRKTKNEISAEVAAILSLAAIRNNDKVGLLLFSDRIEKYIPPRKKTQDVLVIIRDILSYKHAITGAKTDIELALKYLSRVLHKKAIIFLISDFISNGQKEYSRTLLTLSKKHDLIPVWVRDRLEQSLPEFLDGLFFIHDPETGETTEVDFSDDKIKQEYNRRADENYAATKKIFSSCGLDTIELSTDDKSILKSLFLFFRAREKRIRHFS